MCWQCCYRGKPKYKWPEFMDLPMEFWLDKELKDFLWDEKVI